MAEIPQTMTAVRLLEYSPAGMQVLHDVPVPVPVEGQVLIRVEASPINPSDLSSVYGAYGDGRAQLPIGLGKEGSGVVVASGGGPLADSLVGKRVACGSITGMWAQYSLFTAEACIPIPDDVTFQQAASFIVNPLTAVLFEHTIRENNHKAAIQNAAGSALGQMLIRLFAQQGIPLINIVRRPEQAQELRDQGAQNVLCSSDPDFDHQLKELAASLEATAAFDAVAGADTGRILAQMPNDSTIYVYGGLSGQGSSGLSPGDFIFRGKSVKGLWLSKWFPRVPREVAGAAIAQVTAGIGTTFSTKVAREVGFNEFLEAFGSYKGNMSEGKILLRPNLGQQLINQANQIKWTRLNNVAISSHVLYMQGKDSYVGPQLAVFQGQ